jgi:hypothetical protein
MIELRAACRTPGATSVDDLRMNAEKRPAHENEMPADGTATARLPGEEFGTSRFNGS